MRTNKRAQQRAYDRMNIPGRRLLQTNTQRGVRWDVVPGGPQVSDEDARAIIARPDVVPFQDGLFPGISQQYTVASTQPEKKK